MSYSNSISAKISYINAQNRCFTNLCIFGCACYGHNNVIFTN